MDIFKNINDGKYDSTVPYPTKEKMPIKQGFFETITLKSGTISSIFDSLSYEKALDEWKFKHNNKMKKYNASSAEGKYLFKNDLIQEEGVSSMPDSVLEMIYDKAWQMGHSSGLYEVTNHFIDLVNFIIDLKRAGL